MAETARLHVVRVERTQADIDWLTERLTRLFHGSTRSVLVPAGGDENPVAALEDVERRTIFLPDEVGLVMRTSGSTSAHGRLVGISASQLLSSIHATDARLGGSGTWVLALPPNHIAGLQVVARAAVGDRPVVVVEGKVTPQSLADAIDDAVHKDPAARVYLSLVPTQLTDCMTDPAAREALTRCSAILVGGAATPTQLIAEARAAGIPIVLTYGMSETCGGCVYDGIPLDGVKVRLNEDGRVSLSGPMVMSGYLDEGPTGDWYLTGDIAHWQDGRLVVEGRVDDLIVSGGLKISPDHVARAVTATGLVKNCVVVGLPDQRWGQVVTAVVTGCRNPEHIREAVDLPRELRPQVVVSAEAIPMLASGKVDRLKVRSLAQQARDDGSAWMR
ncbi:AMP-binding protein [Cutibacterium sp.]|uniref:AMP-binding protein n=1 Tax=Cutibacterium sp. TaxID=1912221 RepID=UPI0026DD444D|nr:AMP-binding protein [Cutibacterium sp.]MDO4411727.1 AMP-binding protein [Cutibacterium sp.]